MKPGLGRVRERWGPPLAPPGKRMRTNPVAGRPHTATKIFIARVKEIFALDNCPDQESSIRRGGRRMVDSGSNELESGITCFAAPSQDEVQTLLN
ncbi:hypothetical protein GW17_00023376 [Ensete ventricosum]|nr:hypothetical protein GW17_00023376 [Ensete ventricosum]